MSVSGTAIPKPSTLVETGTGIHVEGDGPPFVSRGGLKLDAALQAFALPIEGRRAIDVGASTGGFTDCLLQHGAVSVVALDVGYGQLHWTLRTDPRVTVVERTNVRFVDAPALGAPFDVVVADLSFISLVTVGDALRSLGNAQSDYVLLVKPQFEAGPEGVGKGGAVRDDAVRMAAVSATVEALGAAGIGARDVIASPVEGAKSGNREVLGWFRHGPATVAPERLKEAAT